MKLLLTLLMAGKLGKLLLTGGTMLLSVFVYAITFGWPYAVGLVALIFVHEMGHYIAARKSGLNVGAPVFIPFVGAWVALKEVQLSPETEAYVGLAGPLLGSVAALLCYLVARDSGEPLWMAIAYAGFFLNLFNLIPLSPFDGGRIVAVISPKLWLVGVPILIALFFWRPSPMLVLMAVLAAPQVWSVIQGKGRDAHDTVAPAARWRYGLQYLGLVCGLAVMAFDAHERLAR